MRYRPWTGKLPNGTEVLVSMYVDENGAPDSVEVAFRETWDRTWQAPIRLERAP